MKPKTMGYALVGISVILIIILFLVKASTDNQSARLCELIDADPKTDMSQCPVHQSDTSWLIMIAFGVGFLLLGIGGYMAFVPQQFTKNQGFKDVDISTLDEDEKKIYQLLKENGGSLYQTDLIKKTELSKVKITRILDKMETNGIVERKRRGMTNIVVLK